MMLSEPPRTQGDLNFSLLGFSVRIHPLFWLVTVLLGPLQSDPMLMLLWVPAVLLCILLHELGHAVAMRFYGFRPWIVLHGFGGLTGYGPSDLSARRPGPGGHILISAAGPATGFLLAAVLVGGILAANRSAVVFWYGPARLHVIPGIVWDGDWLKTMHFVYFVLQVTVLWGLFNLLPIFPLDGGQIAQQVLLLASPRDGVRQSLMLSVLAAGSLAGIAAIQWKDFYLAIFFGYLAYSSYTMLQYGGR
jgi:Zn-dependent protease